MTSTPSFESIKRCVRSRADAVRIACELEVQSPKLGNVHPTARFDDCDYLDFLKAASEIAPVLGSTDATLSLGDRVLLAVERTRQVTSSNVNLGIILLVAPLAMADDILAIRQVLASITSEDGRKVFEAIRLASPGGMRREDVAPEQDVQTLHPQPLDLMAAMQQAASRDRIALQFTTDFRDFFANVVPVVRAELLHSVSIQAAIVSAQLILMSREIDSLIARKCGIETAQEAKIRAAQCVIASERSDGPEARARFDAWLRADGNRRNPGTTADFIAAALFWLLREPNA